MASVIGNNRAARLDLNHGPVNLILTRLPVTSGINEQHTEDQR
jgi:hypothetical protein